MVALDGLRLQLTKAGAVDPNGKVFVLAKDAADVLAGTKPVEPLAIRANIGDCVAVTLTSMQHDANDFAGFSKANIHIHHVQFDTQASDGVDHRHVVRAERAPVPGRGSEDRCARSCRRNDPQPLERGEVPGR